MIMADMAAFGNVKELTEMAEDLATFVQQAAVEGAAAHEVELGVWQRVLAMGRLAMGRFFEIQGDGDVGETIELPDGEELKRLPEPHHRTYHSIFGAFTFSRYVYGTREGQRIGFVPLDARLQLPESEYSYVLQDWAGTLCVEHAFGRTAETLRAILGLSLPVDSLERMSRKMGESVEEFRTSLKKLTRICNYFEGNRGRMRYDAYLAAGYPIASGVIEGACRHLVKDRMERAGMRWTIDGAQAMLDLPSTYVNDQWSALETHRIHAEAQRLYPQPQLLPQLIFHLAA